MKIVRVVNKDLEYFQNEINNILYEDDSDTSNVLYIEHLDNNWIALIATPTKVYENKIVNHYKGH